MDRVLAGVKPVIGVTGGIGSGKTTVANRMGALGATVVDTDEISRALTAAGGEAIAALVEAFGASALGPDGALDRAAMRARVFADGSARATLEAILHPMIRARADRELAGAAGPYALVVVPLLFETRGYLDRIDRALVVDCPEALQVERVAARSALAPNEVRRIMEAQWPRWRRLQCADDVAWNGGSEAALAPQCERLHAFYAQLGVSPRGNICQWERVGPKSGRTNDGVR